MRYIVLYYLANNLNVIKGAEVITANSINQAKEKSARNLEENIVIPINKSNLIKLHNILAEIQKTE